MEREGDHVKRGGSKGLKWEKTEKKCGQRVRKNTNTNKNKIRKGRRNRSPTVTEKAHDSWSRKFEIERNTYPNWRLKVKRHGRAKANQFGVQVGAAPSCPHVRCPQVLSRNFHTGSMVVLVLLMVLLLLWAIGSRGGGRRGGGRGCQVCVEVEVVQ